MGYTAFFAHPGGSPPLNWPKWEEYITMEMGKCTQEYEMLPLVQDKALLDNILYSGVWVNYRAKRKEEHR